MYKASCIMHPWLVSLLFLLFYPVYVHRPPRDSQSSISGRVLSHTMAYTLTPNDLFDLSSGPRETVFNHTTTNNNNDNNNSPPFFLGPLNYSLQFSERYTSPDPVLSAAPPSQSLDSYREPSVFVSSPGYPLRYYP